VFFNTKAFSERDEGVGVVVFLHTKSLGE